MARKNSKLKTVPPIRRVDAMITAHALLGRVAIDAGWTGEALGTIANVRGIRCYLVEGPGAFDCVLIAADVSGIRTNSSNSAGPSVGCCSTSDPNESLTTFLRTY